ncbi:MAG: hypothetical protein BIFFINMI_02947 [Phycisphaerae bacterium]|nr:hypothetical protein [Phycisphaerae bacterium]
MRKLVQYLRLMRFPLVFTAVGDAWAVRWLGGGFDGEGPWAMPPAGQLAMLAAVSFGLYGLGMVLNDAMDARRDAATQPDKPIPSGAVPRWTADLLAGSLWLAALTVAWFYGRATFGVAFAASVLIVGYDVGLKSIPVVGLLLLGLIRAVQCQISGVGYAGEAANLTLWASLFLFTHVAAVSWIAYVLEGKQPALSPAGHRLLGGLIATLDLGLLLLLSLTLSESDGLGVSLGLLAERMSHLAIPLSAAAAYLFLLLRILRSRRWPTGPDKGRMAMRMGLMWLLVYDAAFCAAGGRWSGVAAMAGLFVLMLAASRWMLKMRRGRGLSNGPIPG